MEGIQGNEDDVCKTNITSNCNSSEEWETHKIKKDPDFYDASRNQIIESNLNIMLDRVNKYTDFLLELLEKHKKKDQKRKAKRKKVSSKKIKDKTNVEIIKKKVLTSTPVKKAHIGKSAVTDDSIEMNYHRGIPFDPSVFEYKEGSRFLNGEAIDDDQPDYFCGGVMKKYQIEGYKWIKVMFDNTTNGILADEMGLGKTIQSIAMISRLVKMSYPGPYLVCAPLSTLNNWFYEFQRFAPSCPVLLYHGNKEERSLMQFMLHRSKEKSFTTVITSYDILMRDTTALNKLNWSYLIVDEAHRLKNVNCRLLIELKKLSIQTKLLLTGTPLQNNLSELWSLLNFLMPEIFSDSKVFEGFFNSENLANYFGENYEKKFVNVLHKSLAPFLLRRTKKDVEFSIPKKQEIILYAPSSDEQKRWHERLRKKARFLNENKSEKKKIKSKNDHLDLSLLKLEKSDRRKVSLNPKISFNDEYDVNITEHNILMHLRKSCNHPFLLQYPLHPGTDVFLVDEDIVKSSGKLKILDQMLPKLLEQNHKILIFSQMTKMLDILGDYLSFRNFNYCRFDGSSKLAERSEMIKKFTSSSLYNIFLLSTRAAGLGINLTVADTVFIYDSDWNPQSDLQAQDRCHRIGQLNNVVVYRLVLKDTVDQMMVDRAQKKRYLERVVISDKKFKGSLKRDFEDEDDSELISLVRKCLEINKISSKNGYVGSFNSDVIDKLLDRNWIINEAENLPETEFYKFI